MYIYKYIYIYIYIHVIWIITSLKHTPALKSLSWRSSSPEACNFTAEGTLVLVFFCEFNKIFKNTYFVEYLQTSTSENGRIKNNNQLSEAC